MASSRYPVAEPASGGLEALTASLAFRLVDRGHDVTVCAPPGSDPRLRLRRLPVRPFTASASAQRDVAAVPARWMEEHDAYLGLMLDLADLGRRDFDVVHNHSLHHLPIAMSRAIEVPVVTTLHTPPLAWLESAMGYAAPTASFVAVSRHTADAWSHVVDSRVVPNGVDTARWRPGPGGSRAVWTGRLVPEKAPHLAIRAAREAGIAIDLAGPVPDIDYFESCVEPLLGRDARYVGHLGTDALAELVGRACVAVVSPRWDEPFGLVAAEAMACGTPVAAFARGGLPEVVGPLTGRTVTGDDVAALAAAIDEARGLPRDVVRKVAVEQLDLDRMVDRYVAIYEETAA